MLTKLQEQDKRNTQIIIPTAHNVKQAISIADITHFEADEHTTKVHLSDGKIVTAFRILGHFKKMLLDDYPFFHIHNSLLINVDQVKSYDYAQLTITLKNGQQLKASRRYGKGFKKYWDDFRGGGSFWNDLKNLFR